MVHIKKILRKTTGKKSRDKMIVLRKSGDEIVGSF